MMARNRSNSFGREAESFIIPKSPSSGNVPPFALSRRANLPKAKGNRGLLRTLIFYVCCLVALALCLNLIVGFTLNKDLSRTKQKGRRTPSPTITPTESPTIAPTSEALRLGSSLVSPTGSTTSSARVYPAYNASGRAYAVFEPPETTDKVQSFTDRWCELEGVEWYPSVEGQKHWQRRAPAFLIPGAKFTGTDVLSNYLHQHPSIQRTTRGKELSFFYESNFRRYVTSSERTLVRAARERMYARDYDSAALREDDSLIAMDATPGYLFYSTLLPRRILCVMPWVKLVILLRNPVDRLYEHYLSAVKRGLPLSFEDWIERDMEVARKAGLIQDEVPFEKFNGSPKEDEAWYEYLTQTVEGVVGRSLYEIQLRHWFQGLKAMGRRPSQGALIVRAEDVLEDPAKEYKRIQKFLHLDEHTIDNFEPIFGNATQAMKRKTRAKLDKFFEPYNKKLKVLLQSYGFAWETKPSNRNNN